MFDGLTENLGDKIKSFAKIVFLIELIGTILSGLISMFAVSFLLGLGILVGGLLAAVISFWFTYAIGDIAEDTADTRHRVYELQLEIEKMKKGEEKISPAPVARTSTGARATQAVAAGKWQCVCGRVNDSYVSSCVCGLSKHEAKQKLAEQENK